jgi:DNA-binding transcriptional LysR family regulator
MNYTLHQLRIFQEIAENGSITKAAERLHLTQPAVSIQLKKFQGQFEVPLMEVIGRKLYITPFGEEILESSRRILQEVENIEIQTRAFKGDLAGRLSFSVVSTGKYIMPFFISGFLNRNRSVRLKMDVTNKQQVISDLESNRVDFALVSIIPENLRVEHVSLMDNMLFLIGNKGSDLSVYPKFSEVPFIFREKGSATRLAMERYLKSRNVEGDEYMALTSNEAIKQAILAGLGFSIMPLIGLKNQLLDNELKIIPAKGLPVITVWHLIWLREKKLSPIAKAFLEYLKKRKEDIIQENFSWQDKFK